MARKSGKRANQGQALEWVGGLVSHPSYVTGEGEPYRPEMLLWVIPGGPVLGVSMGKPGELLAQAADHLRDTMAGSMVGSVPAPARVRVASQELARALESVADLRPEIVCAPTPELDEVLEAMREHLAGGEGGMRSYLEGGLDADAVGSLFRAAAALFRASPWKVLPEDASVLSVTIESLGVRDAALSVIGHLGESFGFIVFSSFDDLDDFSDAAEAVERGEPVTSPAHFALEFERGAEVSPALRREIADHGWEVAGADAYPLLVSIDDDLVVRPTTSHEVTITEAIARALTQVLVENAERPGAWTDAPTFSHTLTVATHAGPVEITLRAPHDDRAGVLEHLTASNLLENLAELEDGDEIDPDVRIELEDAIMDRFSRSPEAEGRVDIDLGRFVMTFAADHLGKTIASLDAEGLREILFEIVPRKVSIDASAAGAIIEATRALFGFLKRECGLVQADACLRVLGGDAARRLERELSDPRNFGMAKSLMMGGQEAGFDVSTKEGVEAWMRAIEGKPLPPAFSLPSLAPPLAPRAADPAEARARKNKRKAERKARKKNR